MKNFYKRMLDQTFIQNYQKDERHILTHSLELKNTLLMMLNYFCIDPWRRAVMNEKIKIIKKILCSTKKIYKKKFYKKKNSSSMKKFL